MNSITSLISNYLHQIWYRKISQPRKFPLDSFNSKSTHLVFSLFCQLYLMWNISVLPDHCLYHYTHKAKWCSFFTSTQSTIHVTMQWSHQWWLIFTNHPPLSSPNTARIEHAAWVLTVVLAALNLNVPQTMSMQLDSPILRLLTAHCCWLNTMQKNWQIQPITKHKPLLIFQLYWHCQPWMLFSHWIQIQIIIFLKWEKLQISLQRQSQTKMENILWFLLLHLKIHKLLQ